MVTTTAKLMKRWSTLAMWLILLIALSLPMLKARYKRHMETPYRRMGWVK